MRKPQNWNEIKKKKTPEEWRRINKIYKKRWDMRQQLRSRGAKLLNKIHNIHVVQNPGPADVLSDQVHRALLLPHAWNQEDYDHAVVMLDGVEKRIKEYQKHLLPKSGVTMNALTLFLQKSGESTDEIMKMLVQMVKIYANKLSMEKVENLAEGEVNFVLTLLRLPDGYFPHLFVQYLLQRIMEIVNLATMKDLHARMGKIISFHESASAFAGIGKKEEEEDEVVF